MHNLWKRLPAVIGFLAAVIAVAAVCGCSGKCPFSSCPCNAAPESVAPVQQSGCCPGGGSCAPAKPAAPVNVSCPISGETIDRTNMQFTRQFNGHTVGFCSQICAEQWDRLTDQEKGQKLNSAMSPSPNIPAK